MFGTALRLNPIGAIITAVQLAVGAFFLFRSEIETIARVTLDVAAAVEAIKNGIRRNYCW